MKIAPFPANETGRLRALESCRILDSMDEASFDRITALAAGIFRAPMALISLMDHDRQWMKSCYGTDVRQTERKVAFCAYTILEREVMVVCDAQLDPRFSENPVVTGEPGIRFYAGAPLITTGGHCLGSLCVIDFTPREFGDEERGLLGILAATVMDLIELRLASLRLVDAMTAREKEFARGQTDSDRELCRATFAGSSVITGF